MENHFSQKIKTTFSMPFSNSLRFKPIFKHKISIQKKHLLMALLSCFLSIPVQAQLVLTTSTTDATCTAADGTATVTSVSGATGAISYLWSDGQTTQTATGLVAGTYTVTASDTNGDTGTSSVTVGSNVITLNLNAGEFNVDETCTGSDGRVTVRVLSGQAPFNYQWTSVSTGVIVSTFTSSSNFHSASGIPAGTYSITVTDNNGCTATTTTMIGQNIVVLDVTTAATDATCNNNDGGAAITNIDNITPGVDPIIYEWNNGVTSGAITGVSAGTYSVTVTDNNNCTGSADAIVGQSIITLTTSSTDATCSAADGTATVSSVSGATGAISYAWSDGQTTQTATNLAAGTYTVDVTDANGCMSTASVIVGQNVIALSVTTSSIDATCTAANGTATVSSVSGATGAISYAWNDGQITQTAMNLAAGTYTVDVTDANGCTGTASVTVGSNVIALNLTTSSTDATCSAADGTATVSSVSGATGAISYAWSDGQTTQTATNLAAGTYTVDVTDANGCMETAMVTVGSNVITLNLNAGEFNVDETCTGSDGRVTVRVLSGQAPFNYQWTSVSTGVIVSTFTSSSNFHSASGIPAGTYSITVTDNNGCTATTTTMIGQNIVVLDVTTAATDATCNNNDGGAAITNIDNITPGLDPIIYEWNNGVTSGAITGVSAGTYSVTVTDNNNCTGSADAIVGQSIITLTTSSTDATCSAADGTATVSNVSGATGATSYAWSDGQTTQTATNLAAGTYTVDVTDANGCMSTASVIVGQNVIALSVTTSSTDATCTAANGTTTVSSVSGATGAISYAWSDGQTTQTATGLVAGTYTVAVTDANGCMGTATVTVGQNNIALIISTDANNESCLGNDGTATVTSVSGGTGTISYVWNNGQTTATIPSLTTGTYTVTATDSNGCQGSMTATVGSDVITLNVLASVTNTICTANNGTATATVSNGAAPYTYGWSNGATSAINTGLAAGVYTVDVTDANGCIGTTTVTVGQTDIALILTTSSTNATCSTADGTATVSSVSGASGAISYAWSDGQSTQTAINLAAGTYTVDVTDGNGCIGAATVTVGQTDIALTVTISTTQESCAGSDGTATAAVSGASGALTYAWSNGATTATISGLTAGTYDVTVMDANGCEGIGSGEITFEGNCDSYCVSAGESTEYEWIDNVAVNGMDNQSGNNGGYADFTNITFQGSSGYNDIILTPDFSGNNYREYWRVWIDFNQDGDFDDAGELVLQRNSFYAFNDYFYIPSSALTGLTRMRVSMKYGSYPDPCEIFAEGEVEDYTIDISICDNVIDGGEIEANEVLCPDNDDPAEITSVALPSGGSGALEYVWLMNTQTSNPPPAAGWTVIPNSDAPSYDPDAITQTTWYIRCARRNGCIEYLGESNVIEKTYNANCGGDYCESYGESTAYEWIKKVRIQYGFNNNSGNDGGYGDYTNLSVDLYPGEYPWLQLRPGYSGSAYYEYWRIWVDWNNDGDFDDAGELENQTAGYGTRWTSIGVPYNAVNGSYRMRVSMKYGGYPDPCEVFAEGEVEDYTINILNPYNSVTTENSDGRIDAISAAEEFTGIVKVSAYPNPVFDNLNINYQIPAEAEGMLTITDITGKIVFTQNIDNPYGDIQKLTIDVAAFTNGAYFLTVTTDKEQQSMKFFKH